MKPTIRTTRLQLRPARSADAALLFELDRDPEVRRFVLQPNAPTIERCEAVVARFLAIDAATPDVGFWIAEECGAFVGWFHLKPPRPGEPAEDGDLEIGYRLLRAAWGRGLATEGSQRLLEHAFQTLRAPRVTAVALAENRASIRVMEKLGMQRWKQWEIGAGTGQPVACVTFALDHSRAGGSCAS
jgi:RimJ/RimL family protein N-acetyltransferase